MWLAVSSWDRHVFALFLTVNKFEDQMTVTCGQWSCLLQAQWWGWVHWQLWATPWHCNFKADHHTGYHMCLLSIKAADLRSMLKHLFAPWCSVCFHKQHLRRCGWHLCVTNSSPQGIQRVKTLLYRVVYSWIDCCVVLTHGLHRLSLMCHFTITTTFQSTWPYNIVLIDSLLTTCSFLQGFTVLHCGSSYGACSI